MLVSNKRVQTTRSGDDDVRTLGFVLNNVDILLCGSTTVENGSADIRQVFRETRVLVLNLVGQLTSVAKHYNRDFAVNGLNLLKGGQNENSRLTKT